MATLSSPMVCTSATRSSGIERSKRSSTFLDEIEDRHGIQPQIAHNARFGRYLGVSGHTVNEQLDDACLDTVDIVGQLLTSHAMLSGP